MHFRGALLVMSLFISSTIEQTLSEKCALVLSKVEWERLFQSQLKTSLMYSLSIQRRTGVSYGKKKVH